MKHKYKGLKVLKLIAPFNRGKGSAFAERMLASSIKRLKPIDPVLNRHGWYYDRVANKTWIESDHGCWEENGPGLFIEILGMTGHNNLLERKVSSAIKLLVKHGICPKELEVRLRKDFAARCYKNNKYTLKKRLEAIKE